MAAILYIQFLLLSVCFLQAIALQPIREIYYEEDSASPQEPETSDLDSCEDLVPTRRCEYEKNRRSRGCEDEVMQTNCAKTCLSCQRKAPAPPKVVDCKGSTYGCCWDGKTPQLSYTGEGCPECRDDAVYAALCQIWKRYCDNSTRVAEHEVVQQYCHKTCNKCFVPRATEQTRIERTLPPVIGEFENSDDSPRRGAIYVWSKVLNPFGLKKRRK
ncbi:uncharacterized protein LOC114523652 [Dendronephthya gigantea]|uniref:uncharacterized protein LOC114523652 n=1 Tax=Dendronephthya gigantea TaxID=151771 RepID=UPI00106D5E99|nr:uncharacterized protein LOC114523652 [Dendronephthya gigantea]